MSWGFLWIMIGLKIPLAALLFIVWWAIRQTPETASRSDDDGGAHRRLMRVHPRGPFPRHPRRGPHGDPALPAPPRMRTTRARARTLGNGH